MNKTLIQILDKTPIACISVFKNKKISYFNKLAKKQFFSLKKNIHICLLYTSPSPRDQRGSRMPSSA